MRGGGAQKAAWPLQCVQEPLAQFPGLPALPRIPGVGVSALPAQTWVEGSWDPAIPILPALLVMPAALNSMR